VLTIVEFVLVSILDNIFEMFRISSSVPKVGTLCNKNFDHFSLTIAVPFPTNFRDLVITLRCDS
jgi:hypothetical protein